MSQPSQQSVSSRAPSPRASPLSRHIFVRVAFPVGILFLSCFTILDRLTQDQLRDHLREVMEAADAQAFRATLDSDARLGRSLTALLDPPAIAAALQRLPLRSPEERSRAEAALEAQLRRLDGLLDEDLYAIAGATGVPVLTMRRDGSVLAVATGQAPAAVPRRLAAIDGKHYFLTSHPVEHRGQTVAWLVTGRLWARDLSPNDSGYLLARRHTVIDVIGGRPFPGLAPGLPLPDCGAAQAICEIQAGSERLFLLRSMATAPEQHTRVYSFESVDRLAGPLLRATRAIMITGAVLCIIGALGLAFFTGRAISRPLQKITDSCARLMTSQQLSGIEVPRSRIAEVNALGETLQAAVNSIEDGQHRLAEAYFQFLGAIVALLDARDAYTAGHSHRVSRCAEAIARAAGLSEEETDRIRIGALLHDIGKIGVPDEILRKHDRLTENEFSLMKQHTTIGRKVLEQIGQFATYLDAVELHHENFDGTGYPRGLRGDRIPLAARIVKVADVYDALSSDRPYRSRMAPAQVEAILREGAGTQFDPSLLDIFLTRCLPVLESQGRQQAARIAAGAL